MYTAVDTWDEEQFVYVSSDFDKLKQFMLNKVTNRELSEYQRENWIPPTMETIESDFDIIFSETKEIG